MKFMRFRTTEGLVAYGIFENGLIHEIDGSMYIEFKKNGKKYDLADVTVLTPCEPTKIICVGLNFMDHIKELSLEIPEYPANFMKPICSIINPLEKIIIPKIATRVDYEGELALIIKDEIKDVSVEDALNHVLGITPFNDITERDISYTPTQVTRSKSFDTFTSFGPIIDTSINPENATIRTFLNDVKVQDGNTSDQVFSCAKIVSFMSECMTLYPGDIISTGTPANVLAMKDGDKIEIEIAGVGMRLVNYVYDLKVHI